MKTWKNKWTKLLVVQFLIGLSIHFFYFCILVSNPVSRDNLEIPRGLHENNMWKGTDVLSYVNPARNFVEYGVFGYKTHPSMHRTVGYPFFLSMMMKAWGDGWLYPTLLLQLLISACMYPLMSLLCRMLFPESAYAPWAAFIFFLIAGTFYVRAPVLMSDLLFVNVFTLGFIVSAYAVCHNKWLAMLMGILFIGVAAQIRPVLVTYPLIHVVFLLVFLRQKSIAFSKKAVGIIIVSTVLIIPLCYGSSIRNCINEGIFKQSHVLDYNLFHNTAYHTLQSVGRTDLFDDMEKNVAEENDLDAKMTRERQYALQIFRRYPLATVRYMMKNAVLNLFGSYWSTTARFFNHYWRDISYKTHGNATKSTIVFFLMGIFVVVYGLIYAIFLLFLLRLIKEHNWLFLFALILFIGGLFVPSTFAAGGHRMRLPVEGIIVFCACAHVERLLRDKQQLRKAVL